MVVTVTCVKRGSEIRFHISSRLGSKMEDWITVDGSFVTFKGQGRIFVREIRLVPGNEWESAAHSRQESAVMTAKNSSNRFVNTKFCLFNLLFRYVIKYCSH